MRTTNCMTVCVFICCATSCNDSELKIHRVIDGSYSQVQIGVEERVGHNLTLSCDLSSSNQSVYDDNIFWGKATKDFNFKNETDLEKLAKKKSPILFNLRSATTSHSVNNGVKTFVPLQAHDTGTYFCGSLKYNKFKVVYVIVKEANGGGALATNLLSTLYRSPENVYCNELMFKCKTSNVCIKEHYVCDKKRDCPDGSDELIETCKGDPCANKIQCEDGRCIPTSWCCDRHHDVNCNVTYRPSCCEILAQDFYDDSEYFVPYNMTQRVRQNGSRYIFITLCILATFFSMLLMLLILSKIFMLAKKARYREHHMEQMFHLEDCSNFRRIALDPGGAGDALLVLSDEILLRGGGRNDEGPPSYTDVCNLEAPPPYTSQDCLNRT